MRLAAGAIRVRIREKSGGAWLSRALADLRYAVAEDSANGTARWLYATTLQYAGRVAEAAPQYRWLSGCSDTAQVSSSRRARARELLEGCEFVAQINATRKPSPGGGERDTATWRALTRLLVIAANELARSRNARDSSLLQAAGDLVSGWSEGGDSEPVETRARLMNGVLEMLAGIVNRSGIRAGLDVQLRGQFGVTLPGLMRFAQGQEDATFLSAALPPTDHASHPSPVSASSGDPSRPPAPAFDLAGRYQCTGTQPGCQSVGTHDVVQEGTRMRQTVSPLIIEHEGSGYRLRQNGETVIPPGSSRSGFGTYSILCTWGESRYTYNSEAYFDLAGNEASFEWITRFHGTPATAHCTGMQTPSVPPMSSDNRTPARLRVIDERRIEIDDLSGTAGASQGLIYERCPACGDIATIPTSTPPPSESAATPRTAPQMTPGLDFLPNTPPKDANAAKRMEAMRLGAYGTQHNADPAREASKREAIAMLDTRDALRPPMAGQPAASDMGTQRGRFDPSVLDQESNELRRWLENGPASMKTVDRSRQRTPWRGASASICVLDPEGHIDPAAMLNRFMSDPNGVVASDRLDRALTIAPVLDSPIDSGNAFELEETGPASGLFILSRREAGRVTLLRTSRTSAACVRQFAFTRHGSEVLFQAWTLLKSEEEPVGAGFSDVALLRGVSEWIMREYSGTAGIVLQTVEPVVTRWTE
jgi:hypothetical protein